MYIYLSFLFKSLFLDLNCGNFRDDKQNYGKLFPIEIYLFQYPEDSMLLFSYIMIMSCRTWILMQVQNGFHRGNQCICLFSTWHNCKDLSGKWLRETPIYYCTHYVRETNPTHTSKITAKSLQLVWIESWENMNQSSEINNW